MVSFLTSLSGGLALDEDAVAGEDGLAGSAFGLGLGFVSAFGFGVGLGSAFGFGVGLGSAFGFGVGLGSAFGAGAGSGLGGE